MVQAIELNTGRLRLRQWCAADRVPFAALNFDPRVTEFFPARLDRTASDAMADRCEALITERGWGLWAVETKDSHEFIGFVGLHIPTAALPFNPCVEIGWRLGFAHWGQGLATEAAQAALGFGFETLKLAQIVSFTAVSNLRSRSVMKKIGMRETAENFQHPSVPMNSPLREHCLYRLSKDQWMVHTRIVNDE